MMRITVHAKSPPPESAGIHARFYRKYAQLVFRTLQKPKFQRFLQWMLQRENIAEHQIKDVQIRTFPVTRKNGNGLAGKCNSKGMISLYPKRRESCRKRVQKFGKDHLFVYVQSRARAALIHELLHLKYARNEQQVRTLTKRYFHIFLNRQDHQHPTAYNIAKMLFG